MRVVHRVALTFFMLAGPPLVPSSAGDEPGFEPLFNGKDFTGWRFGNDLLEGKTEASDGRFKVDDGTIVDQRVQPGPASPRWRRSTPSPRSPATSSSASNSRQPGRQQRSPPP